MTRTRTRNVSLSWPGNVSFYQANGDQLSSNGTSYSTNTTETMGDTLTPGYFSKQRRGLVLPMNPMSHTKFLNETAEDSTSRWTIRGKYSPYFDYGSCVFTGSLSRGYWWGKTSTLWPAWVGTTPTWASDAVALTGALANARGRGFDLLTFAKEFGKVVTLIKGVEKRLFKRADLILDRVNGRRVGTHTKAGYMKRQRDLAREFADTWLEMRYGWRTLYYDMVGAEEAIQAFRSAATPIVRGYETLTDSKTRSLYTTSTVTSQIVKYSPSVGGINVPCSGWVKQDLVYEKRAGCLLEARMQDFLQVDPLVTTWEVIPFSFIADWFFNLGDVIQAYSPFAPEQLVSAWVSTKESLRTYAQATAGSGDIYGGVQQVYTKTAGGTSMTSSVKETYLRYAASPSVGFSVRADLSVPKLGDLVALFVARYLKLNRKLNNPSRL